MKDGWLVVFVILVACLVWSGANESLEWKRNVDAVLLWGGIFGIVFFVCREFVRRVRR